MCFLALSSPLHSGIRDPEHAPCPKDLCGYRHGPDFHTTAPVNTREGYRAWHVAGDIGRLEHLCNLSDTLEDTCRDTGDLVK